VQLRDQATLEFFIINFITLRELSHRQEEIINFAPQSLSRVLTLADFSSTMPDSYLSRGSLSIFIIQLVDFAQSFESERTK
jgi:hypothetical protein